MNDEEYILAGAKLAGWTIRKDGQILDGVCGYFGHTDDGPIRDVLAAQLVRQVDYPYGVYQYPIGVSVSSMDIEAARELARVDGPDRTMNTIKVIVDSEVLT